MYFCAKRIRRDRREREEKKGRDCSLPELQGFSELRRGYSDGVRPIRLVRVVEGQDPVVVGLAPRHGLVEGGEVGCDSSVDHVERERAVVGPLDQEARLDSSVVRPFQGDLWPSCCSSPRR